MPSGSRLVARICSLRAARSSASTSTAQASQQVLAVVQHQQHVPSRQDRDQRACQWLTRGLIDAQNASQPPRHQQRVRHRRQLHQPDSVGVVRHRTARDLEREPRLAAAADPRQRQQPRPG